MSPKDFLPDSEAVAKMIAIFERVAPESRERLLDVISTYLGSCRSVKQQTKQLEHPHHEAPGALPKFTEDRSLSPKEFMLQKQPKTDVERVACLAYYLTHYLNVPKFKTVDISRLNTEAAQIKFSNPAFAVTNATNTNYLTQAGRGSKQITAMGEQFVAALPDREAAKAAIATFVRRRTSKKRRIPTRRSK